MRTCCCSSWAVTRCAQEWWRADREVVVAGVCQSPVLGEVVVWGVGPMGGLIPRRRAHGRRGGRWRTGRSWGKRGRCKQGFLYLGGWHTPAASGDESSGQPRGEHRRSPLFGPVSLLCASLESSYVLIPLSRSPHVTAYSGPLPPDMQFLKLRPQTRRVKEESPWAQCAPTRPRLIDPPTVPPLFGLVTANAAR